MKDWKYQRMTPTKDLNRGPKATFQKNCLPTGLANKFPLKKKQLDSDMAIFLLANGIHGSTKKAQ